MIRILLVDDQNLIQEGIKALLDQHAELKVIGTVRDGRSAIKLVDILHPDIVLLDIEMPGMDGITVTKYISCLVPKTKVIILTSHEDKKYVTQALLAGAKGYILKSSLMTDLKHAILAVDNGYSQLESRLLAKVFNVNSFKFKKSKSFAASKIDRENNENNIEEQPLEKKHSNSLGRNNNLLLSSDNPQEDSKANEFLDTENTSTISSSTYSVFLELEKQPSNQDNFESQLAELDQGTDTENLDSSLSQITPPQNSDNFESQLAELDQGTDVENLDSSLSQITPPQNSDNFESQLAELDQGTDVENLDSSLSQITPSQNSDNFESQLAELNPETDTENFDSQLFELIQPEDISDFESQLSKLIKETDNFDSQLSQQLSQENDKNNLNSELSELTQQTDNLDLEISKLTQIGDVVNSEQKLPKLIKETDNFDSQLSQQLSQENEKSETNFALSHQPKNQKIYLKNTQESEVKQQLLPLINKAALMPISDPFSLAQNKIKKDNRSKFIVISSIVKKYFDRIISQKSISQYKSYTLKYQLKLNLYKTKIIQSLKSKISQYSSSNNQYRIKLYESKLKLILILKEWKKKGVFSNIGLMLIGGLIFFLIHNLLQ